MINYESEIKEALKMANKEKKAFYLDVKCSLIVD